jgi:sec-independent protein translocase protein TatB
MFDFAWSEIALIGVVALVLIGPKDMPVAVKAVANVVKKARRMAAEFQTHVDDMVRDTELAEVRQQINEIRNFDIRGEVERAVDADGSLRKSFADPFVTPPVALAETEFAQAPNPVLAPSPSQEQNGAASLSHGDAAVTTMPEARESEGAPEFIPPAIAQAPEPPEFIPPGTARARNGAARRPFA